MDSACGQVSPVFLPFLPACLPACVAALLPSWLRTFLLTLGSARGQEHAAHALLGLDNDNTHNQQQITTLLVGLLGSGELKAKSHAAASLRRLIVEDASSRDEVGSRK